MTRNQSSSSEKEQIMLFALMDYTEEYNHQLSSLGKTNKKVDDITFHFR